MMKDYIGELKNTYFKRIKEGKGIYYYFKNNFFGRKKYEGDWKNDKKEGKGILYYNNGTKQEGEWQDNELVKEI